MPLFSPTRILRAATAHKESYAGITNWSQTLALPKSAFPARASPKEIEAYRVRCADEFYTWQKERSLKQSQPNGKELSGPFVLHDGPPYANGPAHVGHALNKVLKDLILRFEAARGRSVRYRPGWDCHGLPIEIKALVARRERLKEEAKKDKTSKRLEKDTTDTNSGAGLDAAEIRKIARQLAASTIETQRESFKSWGVMGDWDEPYKTMDAKFEMKQLAVFGQMVHNGLISRHHRPVYWSPSSRTALAEAELEYDDAHRCIAAFVKLPFARLPTVLQGVEGVSPGKVSALIWTTTPWTLPANKALAVHDEIEYVLVKLTPPSGVTDDHVLLIAKERVEHVLSHLPEGTSMKYIGKPLTGAQLTAGNPTCWNLFLEAESPLMSAGFVTATSGTGVVHMAPDHGMEDYQVCQQYGIDSTTNSVDGQGQYSEDCLFAEPHRSNLIGLDVQSEGVKAVLDIIASPGEYIKSEIYASRESLLVASHEFTHKNPIDWRTKQPVIVRATAQWFADVSAIKDRVLTSLEDVKFLPQSAKTRLSTFVGGRSQWCISRQRAWGVPIPALYHKETGEACITDQSISHIVSVIQERGTDAWFSDPIDDPAWVIPDLDPKAWIRGTDTMDVWFDSGTTWTTLEKRDGRPVSDVYVEGTDQHRGWFQSSLLTSVAVQDKTENPRAPYETLITHGFVLDREGRKMSKSIGNVIAPDQIVSGSLLPPLKPKKQKGKKNVVNGASPGNNTPQYDSMGPDVLRLWAASSDYTRDVSVAIPVLQEVQQALQKYRVTFKFLLGVMSDYPSHQPDMSLISKLSFADEVILHQLAKCSQATYQAYGEYQFHRAIKEINSLINNDLSAFYFEICKDRMYTGSEQVRRHTQTVLFIILQELTKMTGCIVPHLIEEVWEYMPAKMRTTSKNIQDVTAPKPDLALHPLRQAWTKPYSLPTSASNPSDLESRLVDFKSISAATKLAQEEARRAGHLKSGLACKVIIQLAPLDSAAGSPGGPYQILKDWAQTDELAELLVVSQAEVQVSSERSDNAASPDAAWCYEQAFAPSTADQSSSESSLRGRVLVIPPDAEKCIRCWKYVAKEEDVPCERCHSVIKERGFVEA